MQRRNSYSDLELVVAVSGSICLLVKSLLFGLTWGGIIWLILSCAYFIISWRFPSNGDVVKHSTTLYFVLSVAAMVTIVMLDKNTRPVMHAFEGTGDTIPDVQPIEELVPVIQDAPLQADTFATDTLSVDELLPDTLGRVGEPPSQEAPADTTTIL